jgi:1-deoxy-D-xylulose-5-phosphate synthase
MVLDNVNSPKDLKGFSLQQLETLAEEIRSVLIHKMSISGGHFGPNLGVVEASIALHYVFNSPIDKIIFDVSHQSYVHKILTGRKDAYMNDDEKWGVTGFTSPKESEHDFFSIGHTSTSISLACGLARARDLKGNKENIIAFIGDGSISGGLAFEGLNVGGEMNTNLIVVVNDNNMAIADPHGATTLHLAKLRETKGQARDNYFRSLGFDYYYVEEGNNIVPLIKAFSKVKDTSRPVVIHICTQKGRGYAFAEKYPEGWHYHAPFDIETGQNKGANTGENYGFTVRDFLLKKMEKDPSICVITPAVPMSCGFNAEIRQKLGKQFIDVGIAEEHAVTMAAGIAKNGGKPIVVSLSTFYQRAYDQILHDLCINKCAATLLVRNGSIWGDTDETHLGFFDIAMMSNIPNLVYLAPTNCEEYLAMLDWSIEQNDYPVAIRIPCNKLVHTDKPVEKDYSNVNKSVVTIEGEKVALFALGDFYQMGEKFTQAIKDEFGFLPTLVNPRYMTGVDKYLLERLKENHQLVITLEDGIVEGGYGQKITSYYGASEMKVLNYGLKKEFTDGAKAPQLLQRNGITYENISNDMKQLLFLKPVWVGDSVS